MKQTSLEEIRGDIYICFPFLFERGYKPGRTNFRSGGIWLIELISPQVSIEIACDRLEITLRVANRDEQKWFDLFEIVYFLSGKKEYIGIYEGWENFKDASEDRINQLQRFGKILFKYLDEITVLFGEDFRKNNDNLQSIREEAGVLHTKAEHNKLTKMNLL
jgi:hypothetical protein